jgi:pimeloyl-ACP methyl ester carboxylesterase
MPFAEVNGQRIYFEDSGGGGEAVLFSHGFLMDHEMFEPQVASLSADFRCITWDERGFGQTEAHAPFTYWDSADDALALLASLGVDAAFFVGMSQGGFIAMRAALRSPERVRGLGLIDTDAGVEPDDIRPVYEAMSAEWMTNGPSEAITNAVAEIIMSPGYDSSPWVAKWRAAPKEAILEPFRALMDRDDLWDRVPQITAPAIIFHGEEDATVPMDRAEHLAEELPHCEELVRIPGAGHASNLSHADEVNGPLLDFLRRHS